MGYILEWTNGKGQHKYWASEKKWVDDPAQATSYAVIGTARRFARLMPAYHPEIVEQQEAQQIHRVVQKAARNRTERTAALRTRKRAEHQKPVEKPVDLPSEETSTRRMRVLTRSRSVCRSCGAIFVKLPPEGKRKRFQVEIDESAPARLDTCRLCESLALEPLKRRNSA